jgi:serine/threonine-protein kinase RsbT
VPDERTSPGLTTPPAADPPPALPEPGRDDDGTSPAPPERGRDDTAVCVSIETEGDIVTARQKGRELAATVGFTATDQTILALAISEIARNIISYAKRGTVTLGRLDDGGRCGVSVVAEDQGPGIPDVDLAMRDGYSTAKSLGMGLPGAKRVMDEFDLTTVLGEGTTVKMKKWLR